jgi:hypothetical protein
VSLSGRGNKNMGKLRSLMGRPDSNIGRPDGVRAIALSSNGQQMKLLGFSIEIFSIGILETNTLQFMRTKNN